MRCCKTRAEIRYSFANFRACLFKESKSSKQDLDKSVTNIPQLIQYSDFARSYQHQSNVSLQNYCHLGLLLLNGNKMSKNYKFR